VHYPAFLHHFSEMFASDTGTSGKEIFSLVHDSEKTPVPVVDRALAKIR
jgi:hypothetical protein